MDEKACKINNQNFKSNIRSQFKLKNTSINDLKWQCIMSYKRPSVQDTEKGKVIVILIK